MLNRRNHFNTGKPSAPPTKMGRPAPAQLKPTVSRETAEIAVHLRENPVWVDLMADLKKAAFARFENSKIGPAGDIERSAARFEMEALSTIETRLGAVAAEIHLHEPAEDLSGD